MMEEDIFRSPQSSISNANFQPSLNAKFRKRVVGKPLQFDKNKIAKLNKMGEMIVVIVHIKFRVFQNQ